MGGLQYQCARGGPPVPFTAEEVRHIASLGDPNEFHYQLNLVQPFFCCADSQCIFAPVIKTHHMIFCGALIRTNMVVATLGNLWVYRTTDCTHCFRIYAGQGFISYSVKQGRLVVIDMNSSNVHAVPIPTKVDETHVASNHNTALTLSLRSEG